MKEDYYLRHYRPMLKKTFESSVANFVSKEFPFLQGTMIVNLFVKELKRIVENFYPPTSHLRPGQMLWIGIEEDEKQGYTKSMDQMRTKPIVLTVVNQEDIIKYIKKTSPFEIRKEAIARMLLEAYTQGTVLSEVDLAAIFKVSSNAVSNCITSYEKEHETILPRRGTIHDLGSSLTHKAKICKKKLTENKSTSQIARETHHSPEAVDRYLKDFSKTAFCVKREMSTKDISFITSMSERLVQSYIELANELGKTGKANLVKDSTDKRST